MWVILFSRCLTFFSPKNVYACRGACVFRRVHLKQQSNKRIEFKRGHQHSERNKFGADFNFLRGCEDKIEKQRELWDGGG